VWLVKGLHCESGVDHLDLTVYITLAWRCVSTIAYAVPDLGKHHKSGECLIEGWERDGVGARAISCTRGAVHI
jgi:hypothetical protein